MGKFENFVDNLPSVEGKVFAITGTTSGTGFVAAKTVAQHGGEVILLNRRSERSEKSLEKLRAAVPEGKFVAITCDLQDFDSVRKAAAEIEKDYDKLFCLANNAGIMATRDEATKDGYDTQMQTNHLSHFLLTAKLFPLLLKAAKEYGDARIVQHSSLARHMTKNKELEEKYLGPNGGKLGGDAGPDFGGPKWNRYAHTKLANSVFSYALHEKLQKGDDDYRKIRAMACHPGVSKTNLSDHMNLGPIGFVTKPLVELMLMQSAEAGTMGLLKCMMDPSADSGALYGPGKDGWKGMPVKNPPKPYETNKDSMDMLWKASEAATEVDFAI